MPRTNAQEAFTYNMKFKIPDLTNTLQKKETASAASAAGRPEGIGTGGTGGNIEAEFPESGVYTEEYTAGNTGAGGSAARRSGRTRSLAAGYALWAVIILIVCILLELFIFNYNHWHPPGGTVLTAKNYVQSPLPGLNEGENSDSSTSGEISGSGQDDAGALQESFNVSYGSGLEH